jgi:hypothetical protein
LPMLLYFCLFCRWCSLLENGIRVEKIALPRLVASLAIFASLAPAESADWQRILKEVCDG